ncbi:cullin [Phlyctochytrium arcticum]|nr:cullin [Phlyctochytrium arcticum]
MQNFRGNGEGGQDGRVLDHRAKGKAVAHVESGISTTVGIAVPPKKSTARKLVIRGFKEKPKVPDDYFPTMWGHLESAVKAIQNSQRVSHSLEELYRGCENLCQQKKGDQLYSRLRNVCDEHIQSQLATLDMYVSQGSDILSSVNHCWQEYCKQMILIRSIFLYLDRTYVLQTSSLKSIWDMGLDLFRERIMGNDQPVKDKVVKAILDQVEKDRNGDLVNRVLIRSLLRMFSELSIYASAFDTALRTSTEQYYSAESQALLDGWSTGGSGGAIVARYIDHVESRLRQEVERCAPTSGYVDPSSKKGLIAVVEKVLLKDHIKPILERGWHALVDEARISDLKKLYALFARVNALDDLRKAFAAYIRKAGLVIVNDRSRDPTMVEDLLRFKERVDLVWESAFAKNEQFSHTLRESFEHFINQRQNKPAELIAKYIDGKLRTGKVSEEELEGILDKCVILFRFISGKDVFEAFYKKDLAKRLLLQKSTSVDAEKSMLSKLKSECGPAFTSKLEGMFKDVEISKDYMSSFRESPKYTSQLGNIELSVSVLTQGYWPSYSPIELNLPDEMAHCQDVFKDFYMHKHNGRRLTWMNFLGSCILKSTFDKGTKELQVSLFQALVLLQFNRSDTLSYSDLRTSLGLEDKDLSRTLQSLACGKVRILTKTPKSKDISPTDLFEFNRGFRHDLYRIKINQIQMKETSEEQKDTEEKVFQDRQYQVDAAIVRIMKTRKSLSHSGLIGELFEQLKFPVQASDLKKRIESLMDRDYLERDAEDANMYNYLA